MAVVGDRAPTSPAAPRAGRAARQSPGPEAGREAAAGPTGAALAAIAHETGTALEQLERCETHLSIVVLADDRAYKILRPVRLPFVDHRTVAGRARSCRAALRRNAALAPDVYRRVHAVVIEPGGARLRPDGDRAAVEHVVEMRRFAAEDTLAARLSAGRDVPRAALDGLAEALVAFHDQAPRVRREHAASTVGTMLTRNVDELLALVASAPDREVVRRAHRRLRAVVETAPGTFSARVDAGWVRELHGDLRAEHVVLEPGRPLVVDALEFSPELRRIDVADELGFLAMDLEALGHRETAERLLAAYARAGGDPGSDRLRAFYGAHRALVRAKVAHLGGRSREGRLLCALAERLAHRALPAACIVVCGPSGSGKSVVAGRLAERSDATLLSSDVVRKTSHGMDRTTRAPRALYAPAVTLGVYATLGRRAAGELRAGRRVIIDATCNDRATRDALRAGLGGRGAPTLWVSCAAPVGVLRDRVARRARDPSRTSDATLPVLEGQLARMEPLDEVPPERQVVVRTDAPLERTLELIETALELESSGPLERP